MSFFSVLFHRRWGVCGVTFAAVALYVALRTLPAEVCGVLRVNPPVLNEEGVEFCGGSESFFLEFEHLRFPVSVRWEPRGPLQVGRAVSVFVRFNDYRGELLPAWDFAITHTRALHVLLLSEDFQDYQHVHPVPMLDGSFSFSFTPRVRGRHRAIFEFALKATSKKLVLSSLFDVAGSSLPKPLPVSLPDIYQLKWDLPDFSSAPPHRFSVRIARGDGKPPRLDLIMGGYGHLLALDRHRRGFAHLHPIYTGEEQGAAPALTFLWRGSREGNYRLWLQFSLEGQEYFVPFDWTFKPL